MLESQELSRYSRNILLSGVGRAGQEKLKSSRILVIGAGGLGSPVLAYLAAAGVGHLRILEHDTLELTNLQRQILYDTADIGHSKLDAAVDRLRKLNPNIEIEPWNCRFEVGNAREALQGMDLVLETTDSIPAKFLCNDASVLSGIPALIGGILRFHGTIIGTGMHKNGAGRPCYRCLFPAAPVAEAVPTCADAGVLGAMAGMVGSAMAAEALKIILGLGKALQGRVLQFEMMDSSFRCIDFAADPACPLCGENPTIHDLHAEEPLSEGADFLNRLPTNL